MKAIILDTETARLHGLPIEVAYMPFDFVDGIPSADPTNIFDQYYGLPEGQKISWGAMAAHNILENEIAGKPLFADSFTLPDVNYIIAHNVEYDINVLRYNKKLDSTLDQVKTIDTLALSRLTWKDTDSHTLSALVYMLLDGSEKAKDIVKNAHNAAEDIKMTAALLRKICEANAIKDLSSLFLLSELAIVSQPIRFGKYKNTPLNELPSQYVQWLLKEDTDPLLKKALKRLA